MSFNFSNTTSTPPRINFGYNKDARSSSPPMESPTNSTRRFAQYKPRFSGSSMTSTSLHTTRAPSFHNNNSAEQPSAKDLQKLHGFNFPVAEPPQKALWRDKLRQQVERRAKKDRQRMYDRGRSEEASSDGASSEGDVEMEEDLDDLDDELYRCIMIEERRKLAHQSRVAYERTFGESDDIHMEDIEQVEQRFAGDGVEGAMLDEELDPAAEYEAYLADLQAQAVAQAAAQGGVDGHSQGSLQQSGMQDDDFESVFDTLDPATLAQILDK